MWYSIKRFVRKHIRAIVAFIAVFAFIGLFIGCIQWGQDAGESAVHTDKRDKYILTQQQNLTHTVTVDWSGSGVILADSSTLRVREDYAWDMSHGVLDYNQGLYGMCLSGDRAVKVADSYVTASALDALAESDKKLYSALQTAQEQGLVFGGLYSVPNGGGTQYVNAAGYSTATVKYDITLYAFWKEASE